MEEVFTSYRHSHTPPRLGLLPIPDDAFPLTLRQLALAHGIYHGIRLGHPKAVSSHMSRGMISKVLDIAETIGPLIWADLR